ncbi:MAG TPA: hypothetical protein VFC16_14010 [Nakamurella sp.]|nr:hypothetical protein [Nakamurella sp.]
MAAVDDLTELVERAGAAERAALASKWQERSDVEKLARNARRSIDEQVVELHQAAASPTGLSDRWTLLRQTYLDRGPPAGTPAQTPAEGGPVTHAHAARAEADARAAVALARMSLTEAHLAVLQARLARLDAGDADPEAASIDGHTSLAGRNAVSRHGPALAHGLHGEIEYILTRKPRSVVKSLAITLAMGLLYLGFLRVFEWDKDQKWLPYLSLWVISVVMGGAVCINAMSFDAMRVRAALDSGARLWHLLVIKNAAVFCLVAPIGFLLSALLAWRAGDWGALFKACAFMICFILLWLGVGNVLSILLPIRDEPIRKRRQSGSLKQFLIALAVAYGVGYLVNAMLVWRVFAAQDLAQRLGEAVIPVILLVISGFFMWFLLTVFAVALSQQPKVRRTLLREIADYNSNAEAQAFAAEDAANGAGAASSGPVDSRSAPVG